jgi:hypothetical protein
MGAEFGKPVFEKKLAVVVGSLFPIAYVFQVKAVGWGAEGGFALG